MLFRKNAARIEEYLSSDSDRMLLIDGARQIGKSYIISHDFSDGVWRVRWKVLAK